MTQTAFLRIARGIKAVLEVSPAASEHVLVGNRRDMPEGRATQINISLLDASPEMMVIDGGPVDWITRVAIDCYSRGSGADDDGDAMLQVVYERLASEPTLGGLAADMPPPSIKWDFDEYGQRTGWVSLTYAIPHRTMNSTLD